MLPNEPLAEFEHLVREEASTAEVERLCEERTGQDVFTPRAAHLLGRSLRSGGRHTPHACAGTSHINPWAACETDHERLNVRNGLLLVANPDAALDKDEFD